MKIALEEHFITPALLNYCVKAMPNISSDGKKNIIAQLSSFGDLRLETIAAGQGRSKTEACSPW